MGTDTLDKFMADWLDANDYVEANTSGSTGKPKRIRLLKSDMKASAEATCNFFDIADGSVLVCPLSPTYIAGKMMIVRAIVSGAKLIMSEPSNRPEIEISKRIKLIAIVPSQIEGIAKYSDHIDNLLVGGAAVPDALERLLSTLSCESYVSYGMTETCSHVALRRVKDNNRIYCAIPGVTFECDNRGCLVVNTPHLSIGQVVTNDIVKLHDSTHFEWIGRFDNIINTGGLKVFAEDVENRLSGHITVPFYIAGEKDEKWGTRVTLHLEKTETDGDRERIESVCRELLRPHEVPKQIYFHQQLNRTYTGKLKRQD